MSALVFSCEHYVEDSVDYSTSSRKIEGVPSSTWMKTYGRINPPSQWLDYCTRYRSDPKC